MEHLWIFVEFSRFLRKFSCGNFRKLSFQIKNVLVKTDRISRRFYKIIIFNSKFTLFNWKSLLFLQKVIFRPKMVILGYKQAAYSMKITENWAMNFVFFRGNILECFWIKENAKFCKNVTVYFVNDSNYLIGLDWERTFSIAFDDHDYPAYQDNLFKTEI